MYYLTELSQNFCEVSRYYDYYHLLDGAQRVPGGHARDYE